MNDKRQTLFWVSIFACIIIVPTLCLLWFMEQAVRNERLSTQQKVVQIYKGRINQFDWDFYQFLQPSKALSPFELNSCISNYKSYPVDGIVIHAGSNTIYPAPQSVSRNRKRHSHIWQKEYSEKKYTEAAELYSKLLPQCSTDTDSIHALMSSARCLKKAGDTLAAVANYNRIVQDFTSPSVAEQVSYAKVALGNIYKEKSENCYDTLLLDLLKEYDYTIPTRIRQFLLKSAISIFSERACGSHCDSRIEELQNELSFEKLSATHSSYFTDSTALDSCKEETIYKKDSLYFSHSKIGDTTITLLFKENCISEWVKKLQNSFKDPGISIHLIDETGNTLTGQLPQKQTPIQKHTIQGVGSGKLVLEFYLNESSLFGNEFKNQSATYIWIGLLSILFIVITGVSVGYFFIHQSNLNKLKNSFLATVTHEIKTPIASCRILVDSLLNKTVTEPSKVTEYYQLISQENLRLSRLVDNFLTFSKMERNKQRFQKSECEIPTIITAAVDVMTLKFQNPNCTFILSEEYEETLLYGNYDAIVTVITNLLDNAYKYSDELKEITLIVKTTKSDLTIEVQDKGIGIPRKDIHKIFNKFYQVNARLNRQREGCGLGLSIVQYIVQAHLGTIQVRSKENQGTTITVQLPL